jgi:glycosyltransferase involved in cell wall biosynthesis
MSASTFSVVIPAFNEEAVLPRLLDTIEVARNRYRSGRGSLEIIVADNCSTDATAHIAKDGGCVVVPVEKRVIGAARNGGARRASGDILAFVDADTQVHADTFNEIADVMSDPAVVGGATGISLQRSSLGISATFAMLVVAGSLVRVMIGERPIRNVDTGVTFCRRRDFEEIGGYSEELLFGEDAKFLIDLKRLGRPRRQHFARGMKSRAVFSTRKFDEHGDWHYFPLALRMVASVVTRGGISGWARRYWYERH